MEPHLLPYQALCVRLHGTGPTGRSELRWVDNIAADVSKLGFTIVESTATPVTMDEIHDGVVVSGVRRMNEVNARRARLVPGWVTVFGRVYHLGM